MTTGKNVNPSGKPLSERNVVRVFNKSNFIKAIKHAEDTGKNRSVYVDTVMAHIEAHNKNTLYPVVFDMIHKGVNGNKELRMKIAMSEGTTIMIDIDYDLVSKWTHWVDHDGPATISLGDEIEQN